MWVCTCVSVGTWVCTCVSGCVHVLMSLYMCDWVCTCVSGAVCVCTVPDGQDVNSYWVYMTSQLSAGITMTTDTVHF